MAAAWLASLLGLLPPAPTSEPRVAAGPGPWEMRKPAADYALWRLPLGPLSPGTRFVRFEARFPEGTLFNAWLRESGPRDDAWLAGMSCGVFSGDWEPVTVGIGPFPGHRSWHPRSDSDLLTFPAADCEDRRIPRSAVRYTLGGQRPDATRLAYLELEFPATNGWTGPAPPEQYSVRDLRPLAQSPLETRLASGALARFGIDFARSLGPVNPLWKDACDTSRSFQALGQRMYKVFGAATFGPFYAPKDGPGGRYNWLAVDAQLRRARDAAPVIQVVIGRDAPPWLWPTGEGLGNLSGSVGPWKVGHLLPPRDRVAYEETVYQLARHIREALGLRVHSYLVWNGADSTGYFRGNMDEYCAVYAACARAVKRADPQAQVGGPSPDPEFSPEWVRRLIEYCAATGVPLDFVSLHNYSLYPRKSRRAAEWTRSLLDGPSALGATEIHFDEWNSGFALGPLHADVKRSALNAAFTAASFGEMTQGGVSYACYAAPSEGWGLLGVRLEEDDGTPRPIGNAFRLFQRLTGERCAVEADPSAPAIGALAARDGDRARIALWGYAPEHQPSDPPLAVPVALELTGLSGPDGDRDVTVWCIDQAHSNLAAGKEHADLEALPAQRVRVQAGRASLPLTVTVPSVLLVEL